LKLAIGQPVYGKKVFAMTTLAEIANIFATTVFVAKIGMRAFANHLRRVMNFVFN
jgi:hypothetical protein